MSEAQSALRKGAILSELVESGIALMRQNLRRRYPLASADEIHALLCTWLHRLDDSVPGDVAGPVLVRNAPP